MLIKDFLYKLKEDFKRINLYPEAIFGSSGGVDYDAYWKKRRKGGKAVLSFWQKQRADLISARIEPNSSIMDIGCGDGAVLKYIMEKTGSRGVGVDMSEPELAKARELGIETHNIDIREWEKIKNIQKVDYVIGLEILEHMPEPERLVLLLADKANRSMFFSFPNTGYYLHRLRLLFGKFPLQWIIHPGEHLRFWTVSDVKYWVKSLGFRMDKLMLYEGLPVLRKIIPSLFGQGIIIHISKEK